MQNDRHRQIGSGLILEALGLSKATAPTQQPQPQSSKQAEDQTA